jgi:hypothetical protein
MVLTHPHLFDGNQLLPGSIDERKATPTPDEKNPG